MHYSQLCVLMVRKHLPVIGAVRWCDVTAVAGNMLSVSIIAIVTFIVSVLHRDGADTMAINKRLNI